MAWFMTIIGYMGIGRALGTGDPKTLISLTIGEWARGVFRQELTADKTRQGLWVVGADDFPGSLLIRLGLGRDSVARHNPWEEMRALSQVVRGGVPFSKWITPLIAVEYAKRHVRGCLLDSGLVKDIQDGP